MEEEYEIKMTLNIEFDNEIDPPMGLSNEEFMARVTYFRENNIPYDINDI